MRLPGTKTVSAPNAAAFARNWRKSSPGRMYGGWASIAPRSWHCETSSLFLTILISDVFIDVAVAPAPDDAAKSKRYSRTAPLLSKGSRILIDASDPTLDVISGRLCQLPGTDWP